MHTSKADLQPQIMGEYEGRQARSGEWAIAFETMPANFPPDESPFKGLPDDRCQATHLGYVISGSARVIYRDGTEEVIRAGEAYILRPGHFLQTLEPVELLEFTLADELDATMSVVARNIGAGV